MKQTDKTMTASEMGKKSAQIRKEKYGHNSEYYRQLALKRWKKDGKK